MFVCLFLLFSLIVFFAERKTERKTTAASSSKEWFIVNIGCEILPGFMGSGKHQR